jgi:hypothetical protein
LLYNKSTTRESYEPSYVIINHMGERVPLSQHELYEALQEQLEMLRKSCQRFDHGDPLEAKQIAVRLRILWHHNPKRGSFGLVSQLNLADEVIDTAFIVPPAITSSESSGPPPDERRLFSIGSSRHYVPLFDHGPEGIPKSPFKQWWEGTVLSDGEGHKFTRKELVLNVANADGGAHVDPKLDSIYYKLTRKGTFGVIRVVPTGEPNKFRRIETPSPVAVTLRQIGHETLKTLCPGYNYDGRPLYPGTSIFWMTGVIAPPAEPDSPTK